MVNAYMTAGLSISTAEERSPTGWADVTRLRVDGFSVAKFDNGEKVVYGATRTEKEFNCLLLALLVVGVHWGYVSRDAAADLITDQEDRIGLRREEFGPQGAD